MKDKYNNIDENFDAIIKNAQKIVSKYLHNQDVSITYGDKHNLSILEYVWICRAMYDDVMSKIGTPKEDRARNIEILYFVEEKIRALAHSNGFRIWLNNKERDSMLQISTKISETYDQCYNHEIPLQGFDKVSQNF